MPTYDIFDSSNDDALFGAGSTPAPDSAVPDIFGVDGDVYKPVVPKAKSLLDTLEDNYNSRQAVSARADLGDKVFGGAERVRNELVAAPAQVDAQMRAGSDAHDNLRRFGSAFALPRQLTEHTPEHKAAFRQQAINDYFDATVKQEDADATTPLSLERKLLTQDLSKSHNILDSLDIIGKHPQAFAEQAAEGLAPFIPLSFLGPAAPAAGAGLMGVQEKAVGMKRYLESKGINYHDKAARDAYLADPQHLSEAESYGDIHAAAVMGAVAASAGLSKVANVGLDSAKVAGTARTAASVPVHIAANAVPFVAASHAANAATGEDTTGAEDAQNLAMAVGFGAHGVIHEHVARAAAADAHAKAITDATLENTLGHVAATNEAKAKADTGVTLDIKDELAKRAQEKAKEDAFAKAEQQRKEQDQQTADEKEAGFRTISLEDQFRGKSRVIDAGNGNLERVPVHPPAEVTPEQTKAEREQAAQDEADRLDRVELGGLTEQLKKRQGDHAKKQGLEEIKLQKGMRASEARRRRGIMDELITANPGVPAHELAPLMRERLKGEPAVEEAAPPAATEEPTPTVKEALKSANVSKPDNELSDAEIRDLNRAAGLYEPEPALNMAGKKVTGKSPDFVDNVHHIVKKLVGMSGHASEGVQHLLLQKKLVLAPNAESIGRNDIGVGAYDRSTGKMYLYTDHLKAGDAAGAIVAALHESTHLGQFNDRNGRASVLQHMMSKDRENAASKKIRAAADAGNVIAKAAVDKATAAHPDVRVQDLELTPYFVGEVASRRQGSTLGRVGGVANDILSAGRSFVKDKMGVDLDLTMGDLHSAAMRTASEAAATHAKPGGTGTFDMIAGRHATGIHLAEQEGRIYKGHVDHMDRFEIPDESAELADPTHPEEKHVYERLINRETIPLQNLLKHSDLYANYPELRHLQVKMEDLKNAQGSYDMRKNTITLDRNTLLNALSSPASHEDLRNLFLHEVQHAVQNIEGFVPGNSAKYFIPKSLTRQYESAKERMDKLSDGFELGRALKGMDFESKKQWDALMKWAKPATLKDASALFLANDFGARNTDRAIARYNEQYREASNEYKTVNEEHEKARVRAYKTYLRDYGETEARTTEFRSRMTAEERAAMTPEETMEFASGGVPVDRTLDTAQYAGGRGVPESFRKKGEGEIMPKAYEQWRDSITGDSYDVVEAARERGDDPRTVALGDWATKATKRYLDKYAGTPEDPLKDITLPDGGRWEDLMDESVKNPDFNSEKKRFAPGYVHWNNDTMAADLIHSYLTHVGDYMLGNVPTDKFGQYDLVRAVKETAANDEAAKKKMQNARAASMKGMPVYKDYGDGYKWVQLTKPGEFAQESDVMGHSVRGYEPPNAHTGGVHSNKPAHPDWVEASGDGGYSEYGHGGWEGIKKGEAKIYSLRDPHGMSHATIEVESRPVKSQMQLEREKQLLMREGVGSSTPEPGGEVITQIKGKQNAKPADKYIPYVQDFVKSGDFNQVLDLHNADLQKVDLREGFTQPEVYQPGAPTPGEVLKHLNLDPKGVHYVDPKDIHKAYVELGAEEDPKFPFKTRLPDTFNMAAEKEEPLNDKTTTPRKVGETEKQWGERVAKENVSPLVKAIDRLFNANVSKELGRQIQVGWMAKRDRLYTSAERSISQYKAYFDKLTEDQRLSVIDDWENGRTIADPDALEMFKAINPLMKNAIDTIRKHDPEVLKNLREFYLPHVWKKPARATAFFQTRGPLGGDKAFTKAKKWPTMKQAMEEGHLEPVTTNPAELAMLKMGELLKYAGLLESRAELVRRGLAFKAADKDLAPEGYGNVRDASFNGYLVHESVAKDLNNYLSRGLSDVPGFTKVRYIENMMVAGKLGWSGFHAGFTTMDNFVTHAEVATRRLLSGDVNGGLIAMLKAPLSIAMSPYEGGALNKLFLGEQPQTVGQAARWTSLAGVDEHTMALLDLVEKGGGRAFMDSSEWNSGINKEIQAIRQRKIGTSIKQFLPAVSDASGWLIHRKLVPAQKAAARVLMLKFELDRFADKLGKDKGDYSGIIEAMHPDAAGQIARKVVNLIDDRLGHMSYDNQFWNPYAKHMAQLVIMAPGWVSGTLNTVTGGIRDVRRLVQPEKINGPLDKAGNINDAKFGRLTSRTSNLIVLSAVTMAASGAFMYMLTGQWPKEAKDYVHPKTGRKNADGTDERISWPTYAKEHFALVTHPVKELAGKLNQPLMQMTWELIHNADFTNTEIFNPKAPLSTQAKEIAGYVAAGFYKPISVSNAAKADKMDDLNPDTPTENKALRVAAMFGMTPAAAEIDHSDAENFINEKYFDTFPKGSLSRAKRDEFTGKAELATQIRMGNKPDLSAYSPKEQRAIKANAQIAVFSKRLKGMRDIEDRVHAWDLATPEERTKYDMKKIVLNNARELIAKISDPATKAEMQKRINEIRDSN